MAENPVDINTVIIGTIVLIALMIIFHPRTANDTSCEHHTTQCVTCGKVVRND